MFIGLPLGEGSRGKVLRQEDGYVFVQWKGYSYGNAGRYISTDLQVSIIVHLSVIFDVGIFLMAIRPLNSNVRRRCYFHDMNSNYFD